MSRVRLRFSKVGPPVLALAMVVAVLWTPTAAFAGRHDAGWTEYCPWVQVLKDDPIFKPGQEGGAPAMDYFGNMGMNSNSTFDQMRQQGTTCLANPYDTSAYYTPEMFKNGNAVQAKTMFEYYWAPKGNTPQQVEAIPSGLKMYASADRIRWTCGGGGGAPESPLFGTKAPRKKYPFDCSPWPGSRVTAYIVLPNCWDGHNLDSQDHMSHMAYPDPLLGCPADHPHVLPGLYLGENWFLADGSNVTFSTGDYHTFRGMFFDAWDSTEMQRLIGACMNNGKWCGAWTHSGQNKAPVIKGAQIVPKEVHQTDIVTGIAVNPHDPDGDPFTLHYQWTDNSQIVGDDSATLDYNGLQPGDLLVLTITAEDDQGNWSLPAVSQTSTVSYDVECPRSAHPGDLLEKVHGGGFGPSESVDLHLDSKTGTVLATVSTDVVGAFAETNVQLPNWISGGIHKLYGVGSNSGIVGWGPFTVTSTGSLSDTALAAGDSTTYTGVGYLPNETVAISFPNQAPQSFDADGNGKLTASLVAPAEAGPNEAISITSSDGTDQITYKVLTTLTLPPSGEPGVPVVFSATGYGAKETVEAYVDDVDSGQGFASDASGNVSGSVTPDTTFGTHQLKFVGKASGQTAADKVSMPAYVTLTPSSGPVGTQVSVKSLYGWPHGETVSFWWDKVKVKDLTADSNGSVTTTFPVPSHKPGTVTAKLTDVQLGASPSATFTITGFGDVGGFFHGNNSPPSIDAVVIDGTPYTNTTFTGIAHGVKDPDGDPVTLHYTWKVNGKTVGGDSSTYSSPSLKAGDVLDLWIRPEDNHGNWGASVEANSPLTLKWEITAADAQPSMTSHPVYLYNYQPFETVDIKMDSPTGATIDKIPVNDNGNAQRQQVPIPWPLSGGPHVLYGVGESSGIVGQGPINILPIAYNVPGSLHKGDVTALSGSGFRPGETVTASFPGAKGVSQSADNTGSVSMNLTMPDEPYPGGDITVQAPSGTVTAPYKVLSSMTLGATVAEPGDSVTFELHGYGASEKVDWTFDGAPQGSFTTKPDGSLYGSIVMPGPFGKHRIVMTGETSGQQHNWKMSLPAYMIVTPNPAHPGDTLTIKSLYGWVPLTDTVYLYWGKQVVQVLVPDAQGSVITTMVVPPN